MELLNKVRVESWKGYRRDVIAGVEKEQMMMIAAFGMIGIIAVFVVFVVFYMLVSHKSKDIGILKSVGVSKGNVLVLFLDFAFLVGVFGSAIGLLGGWQFLAGRSSGYSDYRRSLQRCWCGLHGHSDRD